MRRVELFEKGDKQAVVGIDENDNVTVTYHEFKRLVELDGWRFNQYVITKDQLEGRNG